MRPFVVLPMMIAALIGVANCTPTGDVTPAVDVYTSENTSIDQNNLISQTLTEVPADKINDVYRDRTTQFFDFSMIREIPFSLTVKEYTGTELTIPTDSVYISITDPNTGEVFYNGMLGTNIRLYHTEGVIWVYSMTQALSITIEGRTYTTRNVLIENVPDIASIDREVALLLAENSEPLPVDSDGDGVEDSQDAYPNDPSKAFEVTYPASNPEDTEPQYFTAVFEDLYPQLGDYDFNDWVVQYRFVESTSADGMTVTLTAEIDPQARGAGHNHGFHLKFVTGVPEMQYTLDMVSEDGRTYNESGIIDREQTFDIEVVPSTKAAFGNTGRLDNVGNGTPVIGAKTTLTLVMTHTPNSLRLIRTAKPFDQEPYIIDWNTGHDIHLMGRESMPGSINAPGETFADPSGYPWAMLVPMNWQHPKERVDIRTAYPQFSAWATSGGTASMDWFNFPDPSKVY